MEEILNESGAAIRHLRCGVFMENFLSQVWSIHKRGLITYPMPRHIPIPTTATADIADVALRWLVRRDWIGIDGVAVHGPEDLSYSQAAADIERVLERPVRYEEASASQYVAALAAAGASAEYAHSRVEMFSELARGITRAEPRTAESTTRTTLATWAGRELLPRVEALGPESETTLVPLDGLARAAAQNGNGAAAQVPIRLLRRSSRVPHVPGLSSHTKTLASRIQPPPRY
jgi:hypothetical protein